MRMRIVFFVFCALLLGSCSVKTKSSLFAGTGESELTLYALNRGAKNAEVTKPEKSEYLFFAFSEEDEETIKIENLDSRFALQLLVAPKPNGKKSSNGADAGASQNKKSPNGADASQNKNASSDAGADASQNKNASSGADASAESAPSFYFGFLYEDDFIKPYRLKKELGARSMVCGNEESPFLLSVAFPPREKKVRGFFVRSACPVTIESASIVHARYGWNFDGTLPWFGFSFEGGVMSRAQNGLAFAKNPGMKLTVHLKKSDASLNTENASPVTVKLGTQTATIRQAPTQKTITLYPHLYASETPVTEARITHGVSSVNGFVYEPTLTHIRNISVSPEPIVTDPGLIPSWPKSAWLRDDFELFRWEQFPQVLFFDTADYAVQDAFFKRLAFFAEKSGYRGKLATDAALQGRHGFNAHDYRAETLAEFFDLAQMYNFPLNDYELLLRSILLENGIIRERSDGTIAAGLGAIVSISKESAMYLRNMFVAHEGLHCLYFTDSEFRKKIDEIYAETDPVSVLFLERYFSVTASLNYDLNDTYLVKNEFMAYLMQQPLNQVADYFVKNIATRNAINAANPELVDYIRLTNAQGLVIAAGKIEAYLLKRWNYAGGRVSLVSVK